MKRDVVREFEQRRAQANLSWLYRHSRLWARFMDWCVKIIAEDQRRKT